jgi:PIN domain nuclease of toxin-antitoxin system
VILLDSNALYWWMTEPAQLAPRACEAASGALGTVSVSVASIWELEVKRSAGRLTLPARAWEDFAEESFSVLSIEMADALAAARLPRHHADPFDRIIIAQASHRGLTIVTRDRAFGAYGVPTILA